MGFIDWYLGKVEDIQKLPRNKFLKWAVGKVLGSIALGLLLAMYVRNVDWTTIGWVLLVLAFALGLPAALEILSKKEPPKTE